MNARTIENIYPLSPMQQGMLFHCVSDLVPGLYCEQVTFDIGANLDEAAFLRAWETVVTRHPILRTAFVWEQLPEPLQVVQASVPLALDRRNLTSRAEPEWQARFEAMLDEERRRGFDLTTAPLWRLLIVEGPIGIHRVVIDFHHLLLDGWSLSLVADELRAEYHACRQREAIERAPTPPFRDYIAWLKRSDAAASEGFWRRELAGFSAPTPLGIEVPRRNAPGQPSHAERRLLLSESATAVLREFARSHRLTLNTVIQGAFALLLGHYSGNREVLFGATVAGRPPSLPGVDRMVGLFINTLPVRVALSPRAKVAEWLAALQAHTAEARLHETTPLARIQSWSDVPRGQPLFESVLVFENYAPESSLAGASGDWAVEVRALQITNYPLHLMVVPGRRLLLHATFATDRLNDARVSSALEHLSRLLDRMASRPSAHLVELEPLTDPERHRLLVEWNRSDAMLPVDEPFSRQFEAQAERTPDAPAATARGGTLRYRDLNERANRLAHALIDRGVGPDTIVALLDDRGLDFLVAMLGVFKAGGAYLPLDPSHPVARNRQVLEQSGARCVLAGRSFVGSAQAFAGHFVPVFATAHLVSLDGPATNPPLRATPRDLAYVIYTSGSTGTPKGAMVEQRGMANHLHAKVRDLGMTAADVVAQTAPPCFDISVWQFLAPLLVGGEVRIVEDETASDPRLLDDIARTGVTIAETVPSLLGAILATEPDRAHLSLGRLRWMLVTGEALSPSLCRAWLEAWPNVPLLNAYGPTECSDDVSHHRISVPPDEHAIRVPIGRPIANTRLYVLDRYLRAVPVGVVGELYVGGAGVGRGYRRDPVRTAEVFLPDPFADAAGARLYRTGDAARILDDGTIEFLGRLDHQVKIRGLRVELGEIEAGLRQSAGVRDVVVVARDDGPGGSRRLVAYVVGDPQDVPRAEALRAFVAERLPAYMVPSAFVFLAALPTNQNGKVDRKILPAPVEPAVATDSAGSGLPRTAAERALHAIWCELLERDQVGVHDNFFQLGGDSILSIQVVARARRAGLVLRTRQIFEHQTIAQLAAVAEPAQPAPVQALSVRAEVGTAGKFGRPDFSAEGKDVPLTPIQRWFFDQDHRDPHRFPFVVTLETRPLERVLLERSIALLCDRHDVLRLGFIRRQDGWVQLRSGNGVTASTVVAMDLAHLAAAEQDVAVAAEMERLLAGIRLDEAPLLRVARFDLGAGRPQRLLVALHHLVTDGVSLRLLLEEIEAIYCALRDEGRAPPAPATTPFSEWSRRLSDHARVADLDGEIAYWTALPKVTPLRRDLPTQPDGDGAVDIVTRSLSVRETQRLLRDAPESVRATANELLTAAFVRTLAQFTGESAVVLDVEGHGREALFPDVDVSQTIGWFTSLYPVSLELTANDRPATVLRAVKERLRSIPNHGIGYGLLRYLRGDAALGERLRSRGQPEVRFNYLGQFDPTLRASSLFFSIDDAASAANPLGACGGYLFDVVAGAFGRQLRVSWAFRQRAHRRATVERLADQFLSNVIGLVDEAGDSGALAWAPSDFPRAGLDQRDLARVIAAAVGKKVAP